MTERWSLLRNLALEGEPKKKELELWLQPELPKNLDKIAAHIQIIFSEHKDRKRCFKSVPLHQARLGLRPEAMGLFHLSFPGL